MMVLSMLVLLLLLLLLLLLKVGRVQLPFYRKIARGRRRRMAVGVQVGVALLLGDALADGSCEAILVSLVVRVRLIPFSLCYHVRGEWQASSTATPGRLDCCTGRARLGRRAAVAR